MSLSTGASYTHILTSAWVESVDKSYDVCAADVVYCSVVPPLSRAPCCSRWRRADAHTALLPMKANAHEAFPLGAASASGANEGSTFTLVHKRCSASKATY